MVPLLLPPPLLGSVCPVCLLVALTACLQHLLSGCCLCFYCWHDPGVPIHKARMPCWYTIHHWDPIRCIGVVQQQHVCVEVCCAAVGDRRRKFMLLLLDANKLLQTHGFIERFLQDEHNEGSRAEVTRQLAAGCATRRHQSGTFRRRS